MNAHATYKQILQVAENELRTAYPKLIKDVQLPDATTVVAKVYRPPSCASERVLVVSYSADADEKALIAGTTRGSRPVHPAKALPFLFEHAGGAFLGNSVRVNQNGVIENHVSFPLLGEEPYPSVPEEITRWMVGQALRGGVLLEALIHFSSMCDAGVAADKAAAMCRRGFAPFQTLVGSSAAWAGLFGR